MTHAFLFPGQGAQTVGMLAELADLYPLVQETFAEASEVLGYDLWHLSQQGPQDILNQTDKTQPALLAASVAIWRIWQQQGGSAPQLMAGHSFGEYSALVAAQSLTFADALSVAQQRGQLMQQAVPADQGAMAAILGLNAQQVIDICTDSAQSEVVAAVNFNTPTQTVIAGHQAAVKRALEMAQTRGAKRALLLPVSVPAHCQLMQPAQAHMAEYLAQVSIQAPQIAVLHNVDITAKTTPAAIQDALIHQLSQPVRWVETIHTMQAQGIRLFFECGPSKVLTGLTQAIDRQLTCLPLHTPAGLEKALAEDSACISI
ncbi:MAG: ACP S-malonyltransferase [Pseudomonadota bacterium]|nr:ACP S-malonyltransferase [Pseudomonadota bacterium]